MKKTKTTTWLGKTSSLATLGLLAGCAQFNTFSVQEDITLGIKAFEDVTNKETLVTSGPDLEHVLKVTARLVPGALIDAPAFARDFPWETVLIKEDSTLNAFCLPGGKMGVYTGILDVTRDEAGLAVAVGVGGCQLAADARHLRATPTRGQSPPARARGAPRV